MSWLDAQQATARLGVKRKTLYTYVSRGWIRTSEGRDRRSRRYFAGDVDALVQRRDAWVGADARAAAAMSWGAPILETSVTRITDAGPWYRGRLFRTFDGFAEVVGALWQRPGAVSGASLGGKNDFPEVLDWMAGLSCAGCDDPDEVLRAVASAVPDFEDPVTQRILVALADHELNPSTFAVRVAASTGASLSACVLAGLATLTGPRHGSAARSLLGALDAPVPSHGIGHPLYVDGDPRFTFLVDACPLDESVARYIRRADPLRPNVDAALASVVRVRGLSADLPLRWFAAARTAGWIAHAVEQRASGRQIRPRARYRK